MTRTNSDSILWVGSAVVAIASAIGFGRAQLFAPVVGPTLSWFVCVTLPAVVAFLLMRRLQRSMERLDAIVAEAQSLLGFVHGPGGDHILRIDDEGVIAADFGAVFGNPLEMTQSLVGLPFAAVCNSDGYLVGPQNDFGDAQTFAVRLASQKNGNLAILRNVTAQKNLDQRLRQTVALDPLTGLPNRQTFLRAIEIACASGTGGFVVLFDIDNLKAINTRHGEAAGDAVLRAFVSDATELVRNGDSLSRMNSGSFAVILPLADCSAAEMIASRLISRFDGTTRTIGDAIVRATVSAGIAPLGQLASETMCDAEFVLNVAKGRENARFEVAAGRLRA